MALFDLLDVLKLNDHYPQKLSFSEAIKLRGGSQNGCQEQYGLEIVRKLLMFDSMAVFSVTTEINKRLSNAVNKETDNKVHCVSDGGRQPKTRDKRGQGKRNLHPMDLLVVVMNCCDDFLRQVLVEKMFANKLSFPILLPDVRNGSYTLLLFALKSLVPEVHDRTRDSLTDTLVDVKNPVVSFIRVGKLQRSKSKLVNELLNFNSFNTFFHRECANGNVQRLESYGSIEAAWFQSKRATEDEFNCRFFTALNLRGDARDYSKQTQFLCQSSTLVVFMVDSFGPFKELFENVLKTLDLLQTKIVVCCISPDFIDEDDATDFELWNDSSGHGAIFKVIYDWNDGVQMNDVDFTNDLRKTISRFFKPEHRHSSQIPTYANMSRSGHFFGFLSDENKFDYKSVKAKADEFVHLVSNQSTDCRLTMLPLQGEPWEKIGKAEREQRGKSLDNNEDENFIAEKEKEIRRQRNSQCRSIIQGNEVIVNFSLQFHWLKGQTLLYYLNVCKIKLDARSRVIRSNLQEEYEKKKQENHPQLSNWRQSEEGKLSKMEVKIATSVIGLEHILREHGQMYEAAISEEIRMKKKLKKTPVPLDFIHQFPSIVARLLLMGQPLELMDGDTSNVPITWLKAVLNQVRIMTNNAKVFVLSIIGVQSSGKSTLVNALFGLQFPVSAGRCTRGIYCHLVPVDKESLIVEYDYVFVVDTEGLGASELTGKSTFRDNELATFAIGSADATIINMKGENWSEMKDILQIVAYGLIRIRKTKAELELMPRCMFVHQNVSAVDAEEKNRIGQDKQLALLDIAIKAAAQAECFTDINKFDDVIKYNLGSHSWYFPDLWNGTPPKARINQDYTKNADELRQYLIQLMEKNPSKLTISSFFLRMSDLWNAMLHNDFVLCFRNTQETISSTDLNDVISHELDGFKSLNKLEQTKIRESICSFTSVEIFMAEKEKILGCVRAAVEKNFINMTSTLQDVINATDMCAALKQKYEIWLNAIKVEELRRTEHETSKVIGVHMRKLEYDSDQRVKDLKVRLADFEKFTEEMEKDELNETKIKAFEERRERLIADNRRLVDSRVNSAEEKIKNSIRGFTSQFFREEKLKIFDWEELFKSPLNIEMPQVTDSDIVQNQNLITRFAMDLVYSKSYVYTANSKFRGALKKWELQVQNLRDIEIHADSLRVVILEVGQLFGILRKEHYDEVPPGTDDIRLILPPGYGFSRDYTTRFCEFACHYIYNQSLENNKRFISMSDPLADIGERYIRSISVFQQKPAKENIDDVSKQIFDYAKRSFVTDLGELIKTEVCKADYQNPTFKSKRAFLRTVLRDLGQKTNGLTNAVKKAETEKQEIFIQFMSYIDLAESKASKDFFLDVILKLLKEMLTKENSSETDFQNMVKNNVGRIIENAKNALRQADTNCNGCAREYVRIFKDCMNVTNEIDCRINTLSGFADAVLQKIDTLYADFLNQANSSFEALVCEENKAALRTVFEKIMGCREKCPFCSAPCSQSLQQHAGDHRANHYPMGVRGTVDVWGFFTDTQETRDAFEEKRRKPRKLAVSTCQAMVGTDVDIRTRVTVNKATKWYQSDYQPFKKYKKMDEYKDWDIPYCRDHNASLYWKWFMAQFGQELAKHYHALCPVIPEAWKNITWEEATKSLDEPDLSS